MKIGLASYVAPNGAWRAQGDTFSYKRVAPNGAHVLQSLRGFSTELDGFQFGLLAEEQAGNRLQNEKTYDQSRANNHENQTENNADEHPIAFARPTRELDVTLEQIVVAFVRSEPERKSRTEDRHDTDQFVD